MPRKTLKQKFLHALYRKTALLGALFIPSSDKRTRFREYFDKKIINLYRTNIDDFINKYPSVWSEEETISYIIEHKASICRFGDGEFKLMVGEKHKSFQDVNQALNDRLSEVLHSNDPNILIGIHPVRTFDELGLIWQKFIIRIGPQVLNLMDLSKTYPSMGAFRVLPDDSIERLIERILLIKKIWQDRKVLLVVGTNSRFTYEEELFNNAASVDFLYAPARNAFLEYDQIIDRIRKYDKDYLIMPVLGPTATILAYDLAKEGYQAIDFGQMPGTFKKAKRTLLGQEGTKIPQLLQ